MSLTKLQKFLNKPEPPTPNNINYSPILLSDSKGIRLRDQVIANHPVTRHTRWWCDSGASTQRQYLWLKRNLDRQFPNTGTAWIYVWLGTCDLTQKDKKYIAIRSPESDTSIETILEYIQKIIDLIKEHPGCKVTILEIPVYSIVSWNKHSGHKNPEKFTEQDSQLENQIYKLNGQIRQLNTQLGVYSPQFTTDLQYHRKVKKDTHPKNRNYFNFDLYVDGIHPCRTLARYWLRKISTQMRRDCWS